MNHAHLLIWELLCFGLLYSVFCRLVRTNLQTRLDVRISIFFLGISALIGIGAPLYGWLPDLVSFSIVASSLAMQIVSARHWKNGVPGSFLYSKLKAL